MLGELFHYFKKYDQEIARKYGCEYTKLEFLSDLSGRLMKAGLVPSLYSEAIIFSFVDINDAIKKFRKEVGSWQD